MSRARTAHLPSISHGGPDAQGVPLHDFSTNANACGPCPEALAAVQAADATRYPDPSYQALRERLAAFHGVAFDRIVLAASASEFIHRVTAALARDGVGVVQLPQHGYADYADAARAWGLRAVGSEGADNAPCLVWRCDPSSPLGQPVPGLAAAIDALTPGDTCVLDLAYEPLRLEGTLGLDPVQRDRVWQLWTPNKALGLTGVRAAYAIAPVQVQMQMQMQMQMQCQRMAALAPSWPVGAHGVALLHSWTQPETQQWLADSRTVLRRWKARQIALCESDFGWQCAAGVANFFCARLPRGDAAALCAALRLQGIKVRDAASFGLPSQVRLAALPPASQDILQGALPAAFRTSMAVHP